MFIIEQTFLNNVFLIPEFLLWASCPWPNHCCLTQRVTHGEQKQKMHSCLPPSSSEALFPWPEWPTSTPAVTLMALAQLSPCLSVSGSTLATVSVVLSVVKNGWTKLFLQKRSCWNSGKRKFVNIIPSRCFILHLRCFLLTVKPKQSQSIHFPGIASCLYILVVEEKQLYLKRISCSGM